MVEHRDDAPASQTRTHGWARWVTAEHVVDVFVYVVVLNLAAQFVPQVISETFAMSLLVAVILKAVLEVVLALKSAAKARVKGAETKAGRAIALAGLAVLLPGSKFVVLELVALVSGGAVVLGGFWLVTLLIFALIGARYGVRWLLER